MARLLALALLLLSADAVLVAAQVPAARGLATAPMEFAEPFSSVSQMVELRDGRVLLYDTREKRFGVADFGDGSFREVARQGKGPLEYSSVTALLRLPGDSIWMWDLGNARTMTLAPDGRPLRTELLTDGNSPAAMLGKPIANAIDADGRWYAYTEGISIQGRELVRADSAALIRATRGTGHQDTLAMFGVIKSPSPRVVDGVIRMRAMGFPPRDAWTVFPDGRVLVIRGARYAPEVIRPDGSRESLPAVSHAPARVSEADRKKQMDRLRDMMSRRSRGMPGGQGGGADIEEPEEWEEFLPSVEGTTFVDSRSRAWIGVIDAGRAAGARYDLFDVNGRRVDSIRIPTGITVVGMGDGVLYATREDADGLIYLQRYALP